MILDSNEYLLKVTFLRRMLNAINLYNNDSINNHKYNYYYNSVQVEWPRIRDSVQHAEDINGARSCGIFGTYAISIQQDLVTCPECLDMINKDDKCA